MAPGSCSDVTEILSKTEDDLVTVMARAAVHIRPKYVYAEERFVCPLSGECFSGVVKDYLEGKFKGSQVEEVAMQTEILLEAANFQKQRGWFEQQVLLQANQISISGQLHHNLPGQRMWHHWHRTC